MGYCVIIVFDVYMVEGIEKKVKNYKVDVVFIRENEIVDEYIEKLV